MVGRVHQASVQGHPETGGQDRSTVVVKVLLVVVVFLFVTLGLVLLQPRPDPLVLAAEQEPPAQQPVPVAPAPVIVEAPQPEPAPAFVIEAEPEVTRAAASLLELRQELASQETSQLLRGPVAGQADLPRLASDVLDGFGYPVTPGDRLHVLLVQALADHKSDAYIDALLNTAMARGEFLPPAQLQTANGRLDTPKLLDALVRRVSG
ncbi:MAG: hypothetical protein AAFP16_00405 [Pseudomonadota bacterium]